MIKRTYKAARKLVVAVLGFTIVFVGTVLLVLPGPGILVIIAGLAILAIEFTWAERYLQAARNKASRLAQKARLGKKGPDK